MLDRKVKVKEIQELGARNYLISLHAPDQARLVRPGQFIMIKCVENTDENPLLRRPFTIFNIHRNARGGRPDGIDLLVKDAGAGTRKLVRTKPGQTLDCLGPLGRGFQVNHELRAEASTACLVAGGVGIAPLLLLAESLKAQRIRPILFYGGAGEADIVLREHFERLEIDIIYVTEDGSLGEQGLVTEPLNRYLELNPRKDIRVYTCGPWGMMKAVHELAVRYELTCEVSLEARMGCGMGACLGCVVCCCGDQGETQYLRACIDGPVMNSRRIDWNIAPV
jgi:dihydroorotate dehydrogenase electron transfer subunit